jgi:hypothetical protein
LVFQHGSTRSFSQNRRDVNRAGKEHDLKRHRRYNHIRQWNRSGCGLISSGATSHAHMTVTKRSEELRTIHSALGKRGGIFEFFWPSERAIYDACGAIGFIECEGLYTFWATDGISHDRVIRAFRKIGAHEVANLIFASSQLRRMIRAGAIEYETRHSHSQWRDEFMPIESRLLDALKNAPPLIKEFADRRRVNGAPPSAITRAMGYVVAPFRLARWFWEGVRDARK